MTSIRDFASVLLVVVALGGCRDAKLPAQRSATRPDSSHTEISEPAEVVRRYYRAIDNGHYDSAYALWEESGRASGQTRVQFENGFAQTERATAIIGDSVRIEGAAGSQYATVPVRVEAVLRGGKRQHFVGTYTVRRRMADGATPEQRRWHIYSAHLVSDESGGVLEG